MSEGIIIVNIHVLLIVMIVVEGETVGAAVAAVGAKEHVKRVGASKEGSKSGVGVSMEGVMVC